MPRQQLNNFNARSFLKEYWQKKALLLTEALPDFESPISPDELAGLSLDEDVESRIIHHKEDGEWELFHGPFDSDFFETLGDKDWTLLVQSVDQWIEEVANLRSLFDFIPSWRMDDIMISFAPPGGSVGPHFDQYDVFLLQASGNRRWYLGQHCDVETPLIPSDVKLLADFDCQEEHLLTPGDILYIPPGKAHHGISESNDCLTISIGFRAPGLNEIVSAFCHEITELHENAEQFEDQDLTEQLEEGHPSEIPGNVLQNLQQLLSRHLNNPQAMIAAFGKLMTEQRYPAIEPVSFLRGKVYFKRLDARMAYFAEADYLRVFANGFSFIADKQQETFIQTLSENEHHQLETADLTDEQAIICKSLMSLGVYEEETASE